MFVNIFPKTLSILTRQTYPHHRLRPAMCSLVTIEQYAQRAASVSEDKHIFLAQELDKARGFSLKKRQEEWLTGRICTKIAAMQFHSTYSRDKTTLIPKQFTIANAESGRPFLQGDLPAEFKHTDLSISHGAGFAVSLVADCSCGIDIQEPRKTLIRVRDKFCTTVEQEIIQNNFPELSEQQHLTLIWTAKEAAKKALSKQRMPGFLELIFTESEAHATGLTMDFLVSKRRFDGYPKTIQVIAELYEGYAIALCLATE